MIRTKARAPKSSSTKPRVPAQITEEEVRSALLRSGYLIEYRIEQLLRKKGWYVEANSAYEDSETQKSRELDIYALKACRVGTDPKDVVFSSVLIECINNPQPIAFITKKPYMRKWGVGYVKGMFDPEEVFAKGLKQKKNIADLLKIENYHHYCRGRVASQFCSFNYKADKKEWMAWHEDTHFNVFAALVKALEYRFTQFSLVPGTHISWEFINPVVVVQGDLLDVRCVGDAVTLVKTEQIKFSRTVIWKGEERGYMIDVVTERAFPGLVAMLEDELERTTSGVGHHIERLRHALRRKYAEAKTTETGDTSADADLKLKYCALASGMAAPPTTSP